MPVLTRSARAIGRRLLSRARRLARLCGAARGGNERRARERHELLVGRARRRVRRSLRTREGSAHAPSLPFFIPAHKASRTRTNAGTSRAATPTSPIASEAPCAKALHGCTTNERTRRPAPATTRADVPCFVIPEPRELAAGLMEDLGGCSWIYCAVRLYWARSALSLRIDV